MDMINLFNRTPKPHNVTAEEIKQILAKFSDPILGGDIISSGAVSTFDLKGSVLNIIIETDQKHAATYDEIGTKARASLLKLKGITKVNVVITEHITTQQKSPPMAEPTPKAKPPSATSIRPKNIGKIIAIASGKGGVGKSTVAFNIAYALAKAGKKTGIIDADIYGPSIPTLMGEADSKAEVDDNGKLLPIEKFGLKAASIGYVVDKDRALIWRGPMALKALTQFFTSVAWGTLDYLIIDLPPGTGDVPLTIAQQAKIDGVVIVATPQEVALADVRRGIELFQKAGIEIIGIIENMSVLIDENSGAEIDLFGKGGAKKCAENLGINYLGALNFYPALRTSSDRGEVFEGAQQQIKEIIKAI
jgi:ATP-binding protein involved in chromosome partitioning